MLLPRPSQGATSRPNCSAAFGPHSLTNKRREYSWISLHSMDKHYPIVAFIFAAFARFDRMSCQENFDRMSCQENVTFCLLISVTFCLLIAMTFLSPWPNGHHRLSIMTCNHERTFCLLISMTLYLLGLTAIVYSLSITTCNHERLHINNQILFFWVF